MITQIQKPQSVTPVGNPVLWQFKTNDDAIVYFKLTLTDADTNSTIKTFKLFPTPALPLDVYVDLSSILASVVDYEVRLFNTLSTPLSKPMRGYFLTITEWVLNAGIIVEGETLEITSQQFIWNAALERNSFRTFSAGQYVIQFDHYAKWLTQSPAVKAVNGLCSEYLDFMFIQPFEPGSGLYFYVNTTSNTGEMTEYFEEIPVAPNNRYYRVNVSPMFLSTHFGFDLSTVVSYKVFLVNGNTDEHLTPEKGYYITPTECYKEYMQLYWVNQLGGLDTYLFHSPTETNSFSRFAIHASTSTVINGQYGDNSDGVFLPSEVIINNNASAKISVNSEPLSDIEAYWLRELYQSSQVWIRLSNGMLAPVSLTATTYQVPRLKFASGRLNTISVDFSLADGLLNR